MAPGSRRRHFQGLISRRAFVSQLTGLGVAAGGAWLLRDQILWRAPQARVANAGTAWIDFASRRLSAVTVPARIKGLTVEALVDSGAEYSVIDATLARWLGLGGDLLSVPMIAYGVGGRAQMGRAVTLDARIGGLSLKRLRAAALDLGPVAAMTGLAVPLVLGQDVLSTVIADIDFPRRRLRFAARDGYLPPASAASTPVRRKGRALLVPVKVEGASLEVVLDTGASAALVLADNVAEAAGLLSARPVRTAQSLVLGGAMQGRAVTAQRMRFAGEVFENVDVHVFDAPRLPVVPQGLLGYGALQRFRAILDHGGARLHLMR